MFGFTKKIKISILLIILSLVISFLYAESKIKRDLVLRIGHIIRFVHSENQAWFLVKKEYASYLKSKMYIVNSKQERFAELRAVVLAEEKANHYLMFAEIFYLDSKQIHVRVGYDIVVQQIREDWIHNPERRRDPFVKTENVRPYSDVLRLSKDRREMVLIPAGKFVMGSNHGYENEFPERIESLDNYYIDKFEVSNADFLFYLQQVNHPQFSSWQAELKSNNPRVAFHRASYAMAENYCRWAGKTLPSEEQWEKAARGTGLKREKNRFEQVLFFRIPRQFPWGNQFDLNLVNAENKQSGTVEIDSYEDGKSPFGVFHMAGNAMEWTKSWYKPYPQSPARDRDFGEVFKVLRGGDFRSSRWDLRASRRIPGGYPSLMADRRGGIRCVYNISRHYEKGP